MRDFPSLIRMRMITLDCRDLNELLVGACQSCIELLKRSLGQKIVERNHRLVKRFDYIEHRIARTFPLNTVTEKCHFIGVFIG